MRSWIAVSVSFFVYIAVVAMLIRCGRVRARLLAIAGSAAGLAICAAAASPPFSAIWLQHWVLPPVLLLLGYWTSGLLFEAPMPHLERALQRVDLAFRVEAAIQATPRWLREVLELAYAGVYVLIPIALLIQLTTTSEPDADRFWTVVLATDYVCFGFLPWMQTRPPRALAVDPPWHTPMRRLNLRVLSKTSIQANTFPSGHAAEAAAAALLVAAAPWPVVLMVCAAALLVSAGAVLGRYHYAVDALAGWLVAIVVWAIVK